MIKIFFTIFEVGVIAIPLFAASIFLLRTSESYDERFETSKFKFAGFSRGQYKFLMRLAGVICLSVSAFSTWQFYFSDNDIKDVYRESKVFWNEIEELPDSDLVLKERGEQLKKINDSNATAERIQNSIQQKKPAKKAPLPVGAMLLGAAIAIPARMGSSRFYGKPLAILGGKAVIERVYESCKKSELAEKISILTDSLEIREFASNIGADCIMTSEKCASGTERIIEALDKIGADFIVNVQGDEPFISPKLIDEIISFHNDTRAELVTAASKIGDVQTLVNPNAVKVLRDSKGRSLYFSRAPLPYVRGQPNFEKWLETCNYWRHVGVYGYSAKAISKYSQLPRCLLEKTEMLEQLRFIDAGMKFDIVETSYASIGIDTPADLAAAEEYLKNLKV